MTQAEKTKAYDKALERAKKELNTCGSQDCDAARQIFRLFPELKESEDGKIKKALMKFIEKFPYERLENDGVSVKDALAWLEKQGEQKTWSEEDESLRLRTIGALETCKIGSPTKCVDEQINWLKSLKDRIQLQPKQNWSEEDQNALEDVREAVVHYWGGDTQDILLYWLKSIKQKIKGE